MINLISFQDIYILYHKKYIPIQLHPYYQSLYKKNKYIYINCLKKSSYQSSKELTGTWEGYYSLYKDIKKNPFFSKNGKYNSINEPIVIKKKNRKYVCIHGRHRLCILSYLHSDKNKYLCKINNNVLENIKTRSFFFNLC